MTEEKAPREFWIPITYQEDSEDSRKESKLAYDLYVPKSAYQQMRERASRLEKLFHEAAESHLYTSIKYTDAVDRFMEAEARIVKFTTALTKIRDNALSYKPSACDISEIAEEALK